MFKPLTLGLSVAVVAAITGGYLFTQSDVLVKVAGQGVADNSVAIATESYSAEQLSVMSPDTLIDMQKDALAAAREDSSRETDLTSVNGRPEFVSPAEWLILNSVSAQNENPDTELLRLVNLIRFNKRLELWQKETDPQQREALADAVLSLIPARVVNQDMSKEKAQSLQYRVLSSVLNDPAELRKRAGEEAARIGVQFGFDQASS